MAQHENLEKRLSDMSDMAKMLILQAAIESCKANQLQREFAEAIKNFETAVIQNKGNFVEAMEALNVTENMVRTVLEYTRQNADKASQTLAYTMKVSGIIQNIYEQITLLNELARQIEK